ncbi:hypothetical protein [Thermus tengchongensis]|uniref:hypothetical protein n=1 Tax=Thermus tengchongensis TaxID=1214928 RepID=UPI001F444356|nr:hypothetical protein [Thermus tengchongensis]
MTVQTPDRTFHLGEAPNVAGLVRALRERGYKTSFELSYYTMELSPSSPVSMILWINVFSPELGDRAHVRLRSSTYARTPETAWQILPSPVFWGAYWSATVPGGKGSIRAAREKARLVLKAFAPIIPPNGYIYVSVEGGLKANGWHKPQTRIFAVKKLLEGPPSVFDELPSDLGVLLKS